jgi:hypothetical protein
MDQESKKEVYFHQYCETCKHKNVAEKDEPCSECLEYPTNTDSHKPVKYEKKDK